MVRGKPDKKLNDENKNREKQGTDAKPIDDINTS